MKLGLALLLVASACGGGREPGVAAVPTTTTPTTHTWSGKAGGCADISLHVPDASGTAFIVVNTSRARLGLKKRGDSKTVDLTNEPSSSLFVDVYARAGAKENYCSDVQVGGFIASDTFLATRGKLTLTLGDVRDDADFDVTMKLEGVTVRNAKGAEEVIPDATFGPIKVGWLPG